MMQSQHLNSYSVHQMKKSVFFSLLKCVVNVWKFPRKMSKFHNLIKVAINLFFYGSRPQASKYLLFFDLLGAKNYFITRYGRVEKYLGQRIFIHSLDSTQMCLCVARTRKPRMWRQRTDSWGINIYCLVFMKWPLRKAKRRRFLRGQWLSIDLRLNWH